LFSWAWGRIGGAGGPAGQMDPPGGPGQAEGALEALLGGHAPGVFDEIPSQGVSEARGAPSAEGDVFHAGKYTAGRKAFQGEVGAGRGAVLFLSRARGA
jgi:hypothetical protein